MKKKIFSVNLTIIFLASCAAKLLNKLGGGKPKENSDAPDISYVAPGTKQEYRDEDQNF